jgi:Sigma-70 region 2
MHGGFDGKRGWLYEAFLPLARSRAARFLWSGHSFDELTSVAAVGLGVAIDRYEATFKNGLAAFAIPWIDGQLKRFITKNQPDEGLISFDDWAIIDGERLALALAARKQFTTKSEYVRRAILAQLEKDGIHLTVAA